MEILFCKTKEPKAFVTDHRPKWLGFAAFTAVTQPSLWLGTQVPSEPLQATVLLVTKLNTFFTEMPFFKISKEFILFTGLFQYHSFTVSFLIHLANRFFCSSTTDPLLSREKIKSKWALSLWISWFTSRDWQICPKLCNEMNTMMVLWMLHGIEIV